MRENLPQLPVTAPEGTYLAWIDARALGVESPFRFFLEQAKVGLMDGASFGEAGKGFVRLNFACSRELLMTALEQMRAAVSARLETV
jgi:cystathionine beta-lyase